MAGVDYAFVSGVVTVFSGEQAAEIRVPLIDDMLDEPVETFLLVLGNPLGVSLDRLAAVGTIEDNDSQVGIDVVGETVTEGTVGDPVAVVGVVEFVVRLVDAESGLEAVSGKEVRFDYVTVAGTATAGEDYVPVGGSGAIRPGNTTFTVAVDLVGDEAHEAHETFSLRVFNVVDAEPSSVSAQGSVVDDDVPVLWISDARGVEGDGEIVFRVGLTALRELTESVTFDYRTLDHGGSATPANLCGGLGVDYVRASGDDVAVTEDKSWEATVTVVICGDDGVVEGTGQNLGVETFGLLLEGVVGAKLPAQVSGLAEDNIGTGSILDPDAKPRVFVDNVTELEDAGEMVFLVQLIPEADFDVSVFVETVPGSAESPGDYSARAQWVTIGVGDASAEFPVTLIDDNVVEAVSETFDVVLSLPTDGAVLAVDADAVGTIIDDDGPPPVKIEAPPKVVEEGEVERFKVTLAWASPSRVSVTFRFEDVTTTSDDYTLQSPPSTVLTIPAGETEGYIDFLAIDDGVDEENFESFEVVLVTADGGIVDVLRRRAVGTIEDSNDPPTLTVADVTVEEGETAKFVLMLDGESGLEIAVVVQTSDLNVGDVATAGQDYTAVPETGVVFDPGVTAKTVTVDTINDLLNEAAVEKYSFNVAVAADRVGTVTLDGLPATGSITDNDDPPNVTVEATPVKVAEEAGEATFTVELSSPSGLEVTVTADTVDGTAHASTDYTALSDRVVSFEPCTGPVADCVTAQEVTVSVNGDTAVEGDETFSLELSAPVHATLGTPASATVTIVDDDLAVSVSAAEAFEGEDVVFTVSLNEETTEEVTVRFTTRDIIVAPQSKDPATSGADGDYTEVTEVDGIEVKIPADTLSVEVTVATRDDEEEERSEVFGVRLSSPSPGLLIEGKGRDALGTIHDNDTTISVADASATEGDAVTFTVSLSNPLTVPVDVGYATEPSTGDDPATPGPGTGGDYTPISVADAATATIAADDTSATFDVQTTDDTDDPVDEADETFTVRLADPDPPVGHLDADPTATGTIEDDDDPPPLRINNPAPVTEGLSIDFTIALDTESGRPVTFTATTYRLSAASDPPAMPGADYTHRSESFTLAAGEKTATFTVGTIDDSLDEANTESFGVRLAPERLGDDAVSIGKRLGIGRIDDNDDRPALTVTADAAEVTEGEVAHFTITLSEASGREVTARAVTSGRTATAGDDYQPLSRGVDFPPGTTNQTFNVEVQTIDDFVGEPDEFFSLALVGAQNADPSQPATVTIIDDDVALSINNDTAVEGDTLRFLVSLNTTVTKEITVDWATQDITDQATGGVDYTAGSGTLTFNPGDEFHFITVETDIDTDPEPDEKFHVVLTNAQDAANTRIGITDRLGTGTIRDGGLRQLTITGSTATEGDSLAFTLTLDQARNQPTTPTIRVDQSGNSPLLGAGSASPADYSFSGSDSYMIAAGQTSVTFYVPTVEDELDEKTETLLLLVDAPPGTFNDGTPGVGIILDDDDMPELSVSGPGSVAEGDDAVFTIKLDKSSGQEVSVYAATVEDTADAPDDYAHFEGRIDFQPGVEQRIITVTTVEDTAIESNETFRLRLTAPQNATLATDTALVTIRDDDTGLSVANDDTVEGDALEFVVTLGQAVSQPVTFYYTTLDGVGDNGATAPADYTETTGSHTIGAGNTTATITVATEPDTEIEGFELLQFELTSADVAIEDPDATGTINDADALPILLYEKVSVSEGDIAEITLRLDRPSRNDVHLRVNTWSRRGLGKATIGIDVVPILTSVVFPAGQTSAVFQVATIEDELDEPDEQLEFLIHGLHDRYYSGVQISPEISELLTITDDDPIPVVSVEGPDEVTEGETAIFTLRLSEASGRETSVMVETVAGSAAAPGDFVRQSRRVVFRQINAFPGVAELVVAVPTVDDIVGEQLESFSLRLSSPVDLRFHESDVAVIDVVIDVVIVDDDVTVSVGDAWALEGETLSFEVALNAPSHEDVTVNWETVEMSTDDAATAGDDFVEVTGTDGVVTIDAGMLSASIDLQVQVDSVQDDVFEGDERFQVRLTGQPSGAGLGDTIGVGTIVDDDTTVSVTGTSAPEGAPVRFVVRLSEALSLPVTVGYHTEELLVADAATAGDDYVAVTAGELAVVTVPAGQTEAPLPVVTLSDDDDEPDERFGLRLSSTSLGVLVADPTAEGVILDTDLPLLSVEAEVAEVIEGTDAGFVLRLSAASVDDVVAAVSTVAMSVVEAATPGDDFTALPANFEVTIPATHTEVVFTVPTIDDTLDEYDVELFEVVVSLRTDAAAILVDRTATGGIRDDDDVPVLSISAPLAVTEGDPVPFTLHLAEASGRPLTISYRTSGVADSAGLRAATPTRVACADVPADARGDFEQTSGFVTIAVGDINATGTVYTCDDGTAEVDGTSGRSSDAAIEAFTLTAIGPAGDAPAEATVKINDNDPLPTLRIWDAQLIDNVAEALEGEDLVFTLELSHPSELDTQVVEFGATQTHPQLSVYMNSLVLPPDVRTGWASKLRGDYEFVTRPVWFRFPTTTAEFRIPTVRDNAVDADMEFFALAPIITQHIADDDPFQTDPGDPLGIGTILDRPVPAITLHGVNTTPLIEGQGVLTGGSPAVRVQLSEALGTHLTLHYWFEESPKVGERIQENYGGVLHAHAMMAASEGFDFGAVHRTSNKTVTIAAGETNVLVPFNIIDDTELEPLELFRFHIALPPGVTNPEPVSGLPGSYGFYIRDNEWIALRFNIAGRVDPDNPNGPLLLVNGNVDEGDIVRVQPELLYKQPSSFHPSQPLALPEPVTLAFGLLAAGANGPSGYDVQIPGVVLPAGTDSFDPFDVVIVQDSVVEERECFHLMPTVVSGQPTVTAGNIPMGLYRTASASICIADDD